MKPATRRAGQRGQALVLLVITSLLMGFTLMTTFSIGKAIHERIAVQQAADAVAYSEAVEEARAFNYFAYSNRAILAHYTTIMSLYGHMSYVLAYDDYLKETESLWSYMPVILGIEATACYAISAACYGCIDSICSCDADYVGTYSGYGFGGSQDSVYNERQTVEGNIPDVIKSLHTVAKDYSMVSAQAIAALQGQVNDGVYQDLLNSQTASTLVLQYDPAFTNVDVSDANLNGLLQTGGGGHPFALGKTAAGYCDATSPSVASATSTVACGPPADLLLPPVSNGTVIETEYWAANATRFQPMPDEPTGLTGSTNDQHDFLRNRQLELTTAPGSILMLQLNNLVWNTTGETLEDLTSWGPGQSGQGMSELLSMPPPPPKVCPSGYSQGGVLSLGIGGGQCQCDNWFSCGFSTASMYTPQGPLPDPSNFLHTGQGNANFADPQDRMGGFGVASHDHSGNMMAIALEPTFNCLGIPGFNYSSGDIVNAWVYSAPEGCDGHDECGRFKSTFANKTKFSKDDSNDQEVINIGSCTSTDTTNTDTMGKTTCGMMVPQMNFRIDTIPSANGVVDNGKALFNQPRTFAMVQENFNKNTWGPFGYAFDNALRLVEPNKPQTYNNVVNNSNVAGRENIVAAASGLAYYHRPGSWKEPPNFYNPFWRAKLQPFNTGEYAMLVEKTAGNSAYKGAGSSDWVNALPNTQ